FRSGSRCRRCRHCCSSTTGRYWRGRRVPLPLRRCATGWTRRYRPAARRRHRHDIGGYRSTRRGDPPGAPAHERLRGMSAARHTVGPPAAVPDVRARRLLRLVAHAACPSARALDRAPDRAVHGGRRELALVLRPRELCLRPPPPTSANRRRWPKPPTSTARTRDCPTIRSPPSRQAAPAEPSTRERCWSARVSAPTTSSSFCPAKSPSAPQTTRATGTSSGCTAPGGSSGSWATSKAKPRSTPPKWWNPAKCSWYRPSGCGPWSPTIRCSYLLRRSLLIQEGSGFRIIGSCYDPDTVRLREFAARNRLPHKWIDLERDKHAERLLQRFGVSPQDTPVVIWGGEVLRNPTNTELARRVGLPVPDTVPDESDVVVVGAGPAGLGAAVYAASDGLTTAAMERIATGGQAGTSSRIENYLGFPGGISGADLAERAVLQAGKFGARIIVSAEITRLESDSGQHRVTLADG